MEIGTNHHIAGPYLGSYAREMAWREDTRRRANGEQAAQIGVSAMASRVSREWKAQGLALDYVEGIHPTLQPRWVLSCDFQTWVLLDLDSRAQLKFRLADLHKHITDFDFMLGRKVSFETQAGVTVKAAELMGKLHDALEDSGYVGHDLEQLLVRLLFCLFADDTGVFQPKDIFLQLVENDTGQMAVALHVASDPALALDLLVFTLADGDTLVWRSRPATTIRGGVPAGPIITTPDALRLNIEPMADCGRYDSIRMLA